MRGRRWQQQHNLTKGLERGGCDTGFGAKLSGALLELVPVCGEVLLLLQRDVLRSRGLGVFRTDLR